MLATAPVQKHQPRTAAAVRAAHAEACVLLADAGAQLRAMLDDELIAEETPLEATAAMELALKAVDAALAKLQAAAPTGTRPALMPGGPTAQQGQFLAFIREYMLRNHAGVAPTHADFQRFFNLTAPSVNSMLIRLERRGFIRRTPFQARAIELTVNPDWIPP
jgi:hypothetical protein